MIAFAFLMVVYFTLLIVLAPELREMRKAKRAAKWEENAKLILELTSFSGQKTLIITPVL